MQPGQWHHSDKLEVNSNFGDTAELLGITAALLGCWEILGQLREETTFETLNTQRIEHMFFRGL